jgi:AcrR family transcriptional regulator
MTADVNPVGEGATLRQAQTALTEQRIVAAATELFLADGYVATTLEAVARRARVAARTVYVRFGTKAALFKRVVDVAIVGDTEPVDVLGRDWMIEAMTAPTLAGRITAGSAVGRQIMERTGALFAVAQQAAAVEPLIAGYWQEGREGSRHAQRVFWTRLADDGLLPPGTDLAWLVDTASVIAAAETYLLVTRMLGWNLDTYQAWVAATWTRLLTSPGGISALPEPELVDEGSPDRVPLVVAHPAGQEVEFVGGDGGNPDRQVGQFLV